MNVLLFRGKGLFSCMIKWQTRSQYSHAALEHNGNVIEAREGHGVRLIKMADLAGQSYDRFDILFNGPIKQENAEQWIWKFASEQIGKPYDITMVIRFITRQQESRKSKGKWFCSELVFAALSKGCTPLSRIEPWEVSPAILSLSPILEKIE